MHGTRRRVGGGVGGVACRPALRRQSAVGGGEGIRLSLSYSGETAEGVILSVKTWGDCGKISWWIRHTSRHTWCLLIKRTRVLRARSEPGGVSVRSGMKSQREAEERGEVFVACGDELSWRRSVILYWIAMMFTCSSPRAREMVLVSKRMWLCQIYHVCRTIWVFFANILTVNSMDLGESCQPEGCAPRSETCLRCKLREGS